MDPYDRVILTSEVEEILRSNHILYDKDRLVVVSIHLDRAISISDMYGKMNDKLNEAMHGETKTISLIAHLGDCWIRHPKEADIIFKKAAESSGTSLEGCFVGYDWHPRSALHTFEVINPFEVNQTRINKKDGIGIIVIDRLGLYITIAYDEKRPNGLAISCNIWNHTTEAKYILKKDLYLGYNVLFIAGDNCEKKFDLTHIDKEVDKKITKRRHKSRSKSTTYKSTTHKSITYDDSATMEGDRIVFNTKRYD